MNIYIGICGIGILPMLGEVEEEQNFCMHGLIAPGESMFPIVLLADISRMLMPRFGFALK